MVTYNSLQNPTQLGTDPPDPVTFTRSENVPYFPWDWEAEFTITDNGNRNYTCSYDPDDDKPVISTSLRGYVDSITGNNATAVANDQAHPWKTLAGAITSGMRWLVCNGGWYDRTNGFAVNFNPNFNLIIEPWDGGIIYINRAVTSPVWVQEVAPNLNVWSTTIPASADPAAVLDFTYGYNGTNPAPVSGKIYPEEFLIDGTTQVPIPYSIATSIANCQATAPSWFRNGTTLYVRTWDGRSPDNNVKILSSENVTAITTTTIDKTIWMDGVEWWGRQSFRWAGVSNHIATCIVQSCGARYNVIIANAGDCWDFDNVYTKMVGCFATDAASADGFNFHRNVAYPYVTNHLELNCYAARNGYNAPDLGINDQGSTIHDRVWMIRIGGTYKYNYSENVGDGLGANTLILGNISVDSNGKGTANLGFLVGSTSGPVYTVGYFKDNYSTGSSYCDYQQASGSYFFDLGGNSGTNPTNVFRGTIINGTNLANQDALFVPGNVVAPSIGGFAAVNQVLTCGTGTWSGYGPITYTFQWKKDGATIIGETSSTYLPVIGDIGSLITCEVTAHNYFDNAETSYTTASVGPIASDTTTPDAYDFTNVSNIPQGTIATSDIVAVTGFSDPIDFSVTGSGSPEFRMCADNACVTEVNTWGTAPKNINPATYPTIYTQLRATAAMSSGGVVTVTQIAGTGGANWRIVSEDTAAQDYFNAVTLTGATISSDNQAAIANFVADLRSNFSANGTSYWDALDTICFLGAGVDGIIDSTTLAAAFVTLKGTYYTNSNFIFGDHSSTAGLTSDGATKSTDSNYNYGSTDRLVIGMYFKSPTLTNGQDPWGNKQGQDSCACDFTDAGGGDKITGTFFGTGGFQRSIVSQTDLAPNTFYLIAHQLQSTDSVGLYLNGSADADFISMDGNILNTPTTGITVFRDLTFCDMSVALFFSGKADWEPADHAAINSYVSTLMTALGVS